MGFHPDPAKMEPKHGPTQFEMDVQGREEASRPDPVKMEAKHGPTQFEMDAQGQKEAFHPEAKMEPKHGQKKTLPAWLISAYTGLAVAPSRCDLRSHVLAQVASKLFLTLEPSACVKSELMDCKLLVCGSILLIVLLTVPHCDFHAGHVGRHRFFHFCWQCFTDVQFLAAAQAHWRILLFVCREDITLP